MKSKNRLIIFSLIALLIISSMFLLSYGFYHTKIEGNETSKKATLSSQLIKVEYSDGSESLTSSANDNYFYPGSTLTKTFTIKNTGNVEAKYSINLNDVVNPFTRKQDLTYELKSNDTILSTGTFPTSNISLLKKEILAVNETKTYTLKINYLESTENQIEDNGKIISGNIYIDQNIKYITDLKIYGNSTQDGTPTPSAPIEVLSLGDHSKNLFDINNEIIRGTSWKKDKNTLTSINSNYNPIRIKIEKNFKSGDVVTLSSNIINANSKYRIKMQDVTNINSNLISLVPSNKGLISGTYTFTNDMNVMVEIYGVSATSGELSLNNIQLEEGSSSTSYKPYNYIDVVNSGKNLFDKSNPTIKGNALYEETNTGFKMTNFDFYNCLIFNNLPVNEPITVYGKVISSTSNNYLLYYNNYSKWKPLSVGTNLFTITPTINGTAYMSSGDTKTKYNSEISDFMIVKGTYTSQTIPEYEPYQTPITTTIDLTGHDPLRKIGDIADYIDYKNKKIIRKIKEIILDGTENWVDTAPGYQDATKPYQGYGLTSSTYNAKNEKTEMFSNILYYSLDENIPNTCNQSNVKFGLRTTISTEIVPNKTIAEWKKYIAEQYANGTPVKLYYQLATPVEETIELPEIDAQPFTNNITACDASMCATNIESSYE